MGLSGVPEAGAEFRVIPNEKRAKELAEQYAEQKKLESLGAVSQARSIDDIFKKITDAEKLQLTIILRADVQGSVEAIEASIAEIKSEKVAYSTSLVLGALGFISTYFIGNGVARKEGLGKIWTHNRILFFFLSLVLFGASYLLLRREKLHENLGD